MRSARIRTAWKNRGRAVSVEEHAAAVAAAAWRVALTAARNLHQREFIYADDAQRLGVMREYLYFFIHAADRRASREFDDQRRTRFITQLARECRRHYLENERDVLGDAPPAPFIDDLNRRMDGYAGARFAGDEPGFEAFRALGLRVQECLGGGHVNTEQANKWVQDQVINIDGPEAFRVFSGALAALNRSATGGGGGAGGAL